MKKLIITAIALTITSLGFSQSLKVNTQDTVTIVGSSSDFELIAEIDVENISIEQLNVNVKRTVISSPTEFSNYFCWDACYLPSVSSSLSPLEVGAFDITTAFSGHVRPNGALGIAEILYTFFNSSNPNDSVSVLVIYNVTPVGIQNAKTDALTNFFPNPVNNHLNISYNSNDFNEGSSIVIYDLTGKEVSSIPLDIHENKKVIDMTSFYTGIYFYTITSSKRKSEFRKIIVQH